MAFASLPTTAAWQHQHARCGFEVVYFHPHEEGLLIEGCTTAVEDHHAWDVRYAIRLDETWRTQSTHVSGRSAAGSRSIVLQADGAGHWLLDNQPTPHLDGCLDVDLESSAMTNALPVHRLGLPVGAHASSPAAYVRALDLSVHRLEQTYERLPDTARHQHYHYTAPAFQFACHLIYDDTGLLLDYPGIATRSSGQLERNWDGLRELGQHVRTGQHVVAPSRRSPKQASLLSGGVPEALLRGVPDDYLSGTERVMYLAAAMTGMRRHPWCRAGAGHLEG